MKLRRTEGGFFLIKEARGYGNTIDEARENAVAMLNASENDDIQFEVIATPKKKTLGIFGGRKAEVRVFVELPDEKPAKQKRPQPKKENKPAKQAEKPVKEEKAQEPKAEKKAAPAARPEKPQRPDPTEGFGELKEIAELPADSKAARAANYLRAILDNLGCSDITMKAAAKENAVLISLEGESVGVIIGHRGETLDSIQYLTSLAASNGGGYFKVTINIGNYREKREEALVNLAKRVSEQVIRTGRSRSLEPMNPYERRIIHTAVQEIDGVVSTSFGEGAARRVVIGVEGGEMRPPRRGGRDSRDADLHHQEQRLPPHRTESRKRIMTLLFTAKSTDFKIKKFLTD